VLAVGSLITIAATGTGFVAASIAVFGFLLHVTPSLSGALEATIRRATVTGGLLGFVLAVVVIFLSAILD
jgi:uncharacterized membrane protein